MKLKNFLVFLLVLAIFFTMIGCETDTETTPEETKATVTEAKTEAKTDETEMEATSGGDLVVATSFEPLHFTTFYDNQSGDNDHVVLYNIYDTLLYKDVNDGSIKPWLAEEWALSEDGLQITIKIREDVTFHDGSKFTTEDVKFTYDTTRTYPIGASLLVNYDYTEIIDEYNCIIHMTNPYTAILNAFCSRAATIMSKSYFEEVGLEGYKAAPIGTGAYKFISVSSGDAIVLEKNENYWGGAPAFDTVTIKTITDINTQVLALESGDVDVIIGTPIENLKYINNPDIVVDTVGSNASHFLTFNLQATSWVGKDLNFRKAIQYAIDKNAINEAVFGGEATIIDIYGSPVFTTRPGAGAYSTYEQDMEKAKEFLAASDYDGRDFKVVCVAGSANEKTAEVLQGTLQELGVKMKITAVDAPTFFDTVRSTGDFDAQIVINTSSVLDMDSLYLYFSKIKYDFDNMNYLRGDEMDELLMSARTYADNNKRLENITQTVSIINEDAYAIYMLVDVNTIAFNAELKGINANMAKYYRFSEWSK